MFLIACLLGGSAQAQNAYVAQGSDPFTNACAAASHSLDGISPAVLKVRFVGGDAGKRVLTFGFDGSTNSLSLPPVGEQWQFTNLRSSLQSGRVWLVALPLTSSERQRFQNEKRDVAAKWALFGPDYADASKPCIQLVEFSPLLKAWIAGFPDDFASALGEVTNATVGFAIDAILSGGRPTEAPDLASLAEPTGTFELTICNNSRVDAGVALYHRYAPGDPNFVVRGWHTVPRKQCQRVGTLPKGDVSYFAMSNGSTNVEWRGTGRRLCLQQEAFSRIYFKDYRCSKQLVRSFTDLVVDNDEFTINLN